MNLNYYDNISCNIREDCLNFHDKKEEKSEQRRNKSVSFALSLRAKHTLHINDYSTDEFKACFYTSEEYRQFKRDGRLTAKLLLEEHGHDIMMKTMMNGRGGQEEEHGDDFMEFCTRGVEHLTKQGMDNRLVLRKSACLAVLSEQNQIAQELQQQQQECCSCCSCSQQGNDDEPVAVSPLSSSSSCCSCSCSSSTPSPGSSSSYYSSIAEERIAKIYSRIVADAVLTAYRVGLADEKAAFQARGVSSSPLQQEQQQHHEEETQTTEGGIKKDPLLNENETNKNKCSVKSSSLSSFSKVTMMKPIYFDNDDDMNSVTSTTSQKQKYNLRKVRRMLLRV